LGKVRVGKATLGKVSSRQFSLGKNMWCHTNEWNVNEWMDEIRKKSKTNGKG
jgi:hypothetical protein